MEDQVTKEVLDRLSEILEQRDLLISPEDVEPYSHDETLGMRYLPEVVVRPRNREAVGRILLLAQVFHLHLEIPFYAMMDKKPHQPYKKNIVN